MLARPKFAFPPEEIEAVLAMLQSKGEIFRPEESPVVSPDPADTKFLHCAQASMADFIVTGNKRDFPDGPYGPTRVVSAGELLDRITLECDRMPGSASSTAAFARLRRRRPTG